MTQQIFYASAPYAELDEYLIQNQFHKILLVCGNSIKNLDIGEYFEILEQRLNIQVVRFSEFQPNPRYESIVAGVNLFLAQKCDTIIAVGGGSAIDVAKCIKLFSTMDHSKNYLEQTVLPNSYKLLAIPTTAGAGSEATRYAVIYYNGVKQSITDDSLVPDTVIMDATVLETLPLYQKYATLLDALCHAMESYWSVNSTETSKVYSREAISLIMQNKDAYLANDYTANANMLLAANIAGKAINITQTTAGHAMCYKLTTLYGLAHGHAAALCVTNVWKYMAANLDKCIDIRGKDYLSHIFEELAHTLGYRSVSDAIKALQTIMENIGIPQLKEISDYDVLTHSVNPTRLQNTPVVLDLEAISEIYHDIFESKFTF